jgi:hypothetical protein
MTHLGTHAIETNCDVLDRPRGPHARQRARVDLVARLHSQQGPRGVGHHATNMCVGVSANRPPSCGFEVLEIPRQDFPGKRLCNKHVRIILPVEPHTHAHSRRQVVHPTWVLLHGQLRAKHTEQFTTAASTTPAAPTRAVISHIRHLKRHFNLSRVEVVARHLVLPPKKQERQSHGDNSGTAS